jgi:hypothetical protein
MTDLITFLMAVTIAISGIVQILTDPRITRRFLYKSLIAFAVYAVHVAAGFLVLWVLLPQRPDTAFGATMAFLGWVGFGMLGLIRFAPRLREPPRWLMHVGIADLVCLLLILGGIALATGTPPAVKNWLPAHEPFHSAESQRQHTRVERIFRRHLASTYR